MQTSYDVKTWNNTSPRYCSAKHVHSDRHVAMICCTTTRKPRNIDFWHSWGWCCKLPTITTLQLSCFKQSPPQLFCIITILLAPFANHRWQKDYIAGFLCSPKQLGRHWQGLLRSSGANGVAMCCLIAFVACKLNTTKHAYPLLRAKPFKHCSLYALMHGSISTPTPQLVPLCCAFPPFRKMFLLRCPRNLHPLFNLSTWYNNARISIALGQTLQIIHSAYFNALQYLHTNAAARAYLLCISVFSEKCSFFAAREISIRFSNCKLDTTKHAYPSLWANPFKYCTLHASMHCSISTPTPQLVPLSCACPPFRKIF